MRDGRKELQLNVVAVDYLRLTTYEPELFDYWVESIKDLLAAVDATPLVKEQQLMQYKGQRVDSINTFIGQGHQAIKGMKNEETHYLIDIAGWFSNYLYSYIYEETIKWKGKFNVPRLDAQKTIDQETFFQYFNQEPQSLLIYMVNTMDWIGRRPVISFHSDLSIALGNRKSKQFRRIYDKGGFIRFETEWHNDYASQAFRTGYNGFYNKSWLNMPEHVDMSKFLGASEPIKWIRLPSDRAKKAIWLKDNVFPSILEEVTLYDQLTNTNLGFGIKKSLDTILAIIDRLDN